MASDDDFTGYTALIVEDNPQARVGYVANLKAHGFYVEHADSVMSAREKLRKRCFDLAWVDLGLGDPAVFSGLEGKEVIDFIRALSDATFVMVVTVIDDANTAVQFLKGIGADDYVTKDRLTSRPLSELFGRIKTGMKKYERLGRVTVGSVGARFFGESGEDGFYAHLTRTYLKIA